MQIETIGKYQLHLIAHELSAPGKWDSFVSIFKFDDTLQDFACVLEKQRATDSTFSSYEEAIEAAMHTGNALLKAQQG